MNRWAARVLAALAALWLAACGGALPQPGGMAQEVWTVVAVHDGDTLRVRDAQGAQHTVRLAGIDAPELDQPAGAAAQAALQAWALGQPVMLQQHGHDRYGRLLAVVWRLLPPDGQRLELNLALLEHGWAWHDAPHARQQPWPQRWRYVGAELAARAAGRGLWSDPDPMAPWDWRRLKRRSPGPGRRAGAARHHGTTANHRLPTALHLAARAWPCRACAQGWRST